MVKCPSCGSIDAGGHARCVECSADLSGSTQSFAAVVDPKESGVCDADPLNAPELIVTRGPGVGERFLLTEPLTTIGRDPGSHIFLNDITVSRTHAEITKSGCVLQIVDKGSLNGIYVDGILVTSAVLDAGDVIQVGRFQLVFVAKKAR
ncbi:MAG: FHA domain-containing protein [Actinobacteria bacterium]|nr:FHA domain-containing protein [Actinomycetota bacterium]MCL5887608.1 FHA domain-containing protein [Actinomycetota bacterium]